MLLTSLILMFIRSRHFSRLACIFLGDDIKTDGFTLATCRNMINLLDVSFLSQFLFKFYVYQALGQKRERKSDLLILKPCIPLLTPERCSLATEKERKRENFRMILLF